METLRVEAEAKREAAVKGLQETISDLQEEVKTLREAVDGSSPEIFQAQATTNPGSIMRWEVVGPAVEGFNIVDGVIRDLNPGMYQVVAILNCVSHGHQATRPN
ncbi:hypothetical protein PHYSODRAFT_307255 [Phytophthora sojae]|uniref:Uncharacterized protein n=1 Tax=Phytophthora sojae (strain P6497) TaxID=1094619 RepID=G5ADK3_PHYSP|nr:hypothetical protein PHYSODRAFT_307255 [Phytophthora sojae]EGZ06256.1 hypothetical protein PHYSODRAFT_307255 [Phytophthora sojae]|eukprot:XP_009538153.1 hypothetical protein PHYSODRAFT_307255 [Phytophthora sojae]